MQRADRSSLTFTLTDTISPHHSSVSIERKWLPLDKAARCQRQNRPSWWLEGHKKARLIEPFFNCRQHNSKKPWLDSELTPKLGDKPTATSADQLDEGEDFCFHLFSSTATTALARREQVDQTMALMALCNVTVTLTGP